jgi:hypothetical protein
LAWPNAAVMPCNARKGVPVNVPVEVGGHSLNPAVVGRATEVVPPNTVNITWP